MAGRFNGTSGSHRALRHAGGASMPGPGNTTFVYSVYVDSLPNTYHTILGFQYNQASFSDTRYKFTSIGPWGAGSAQNFAYSDGVDTVAGAPTLGQWYRQAFRIETVGSDHVTTYWPDLVGNPSYSVSRTYATTFYQVNGASLVVFTADPTIGGGGGGPTAPGKPYFTNVLHNTMTASWSAGGAGTTQYQWRVNGGSWTNVGAALTASVTGLTASTLQTFEVQAGDATPNWSTSASDTITTNAVSGGGGGTQLTMTHVNSGSLSANGATSSLSWTAGRGVLVHLASAYSSSFATSHTITGGGVTWVAFPEDGTGFLYHGYRARRANAIFVATDGSGNLATPSTGALTISALGGGGSVAQIAWDATELANYALTTAALIASVKMQDVATGSTSLTSSSVGTIGANELVVTCAGCEGGSDGFVASSGVTEVHNAQGGSDVRAFSVGYSTTDNTPSVEWTNTSVGAGLIAARLVAGAGGGGGGGIDPPTTAGFNTLTATSVNITWGAGGAGTTQYQYRVNGGSWTNTGATQSASLSSLTADTEYLIEIQAGDATPTWSPTVSVQLTTNSASGGTLKAGAMNLLINGQRLYI
ncbi:MAG: hypothetical protein IPH53_22835 [Flavobacteriales bacterium]|nr:hypothetical protein [Flavobacteriales bacterium]